MFDFFKHKKEEENQEQIEDKGFSLSFSSLKNAISKTSESIVQGVSDVVANQEKLDDDMLEEIEEKLIKADLGLDNAVNITEKLRDKNISAQDVQSFLKQEFNDVLTDCGNTDLNLKNGLNIMLVTGVNGAGKTTLIGKLAYRFKQEGKKVLIAAGDTFRAAAEEQLDIWSKRAGADIVRRDGADPGAVVFDAVKKAKEEGYNLLLIDTAGRLQNKFNLMEELKKIKRVIDKEANEDLVESILVLDATIGQNGLKQAEVFQETVDLTSVALTKLDGSSKGGIIFAIAKELKLPVKLIGVGEKMQDLKKFDKDDFVEALFETN